MEAKITPKELKAKMQADMDRLVRQMCEAINGAELGRIIPDSEEPIRDAHAEFREAVYQKAIDLLGEKLAQEAFSPSGQPTGTLVAEQGQAEDLPPDGERPADDPPGGVLE
jgi:hypothetical protein